MSDNWFAWSPLAGKTSQSMPFQLVKASDGSDLTGKVAADLTAYYWRQGGTATAISLSDLAAVDSAYSSGGVKEIDATNMPGLYRLDIPDAAIASGAEWVVISIKCSTAVTYRVLMVLSTVGTADIEAQTDDIGVAGAGLTGLPELVWASTVRTLTQPASSLSSSVSGSDFTIRRGDSFSVTLTGLPANTGYSKIWVTIKNSYDDNDTASVAQWLLSNPGVGTDGLQVLNGAAGTAAQGSITVNSATSITVTLDEAASKLLSVKSGLVYDVQYLISGTISTALVGTCSVLPDVTRAVA